MKLWQKIFLCALLLTTAAIDLTALVLVRGNHALLLSREQTRCAAEQESLAISIANRVVYQRLAQNKILLNPQTVEELIDESLRAVATDELGAAVYALENDADKTGENRIAAYGADPIVLYGNRASLLSKEAYSLVPVEVEGRHYLLTGSTLTLEGRDYALFTASDITEIYEAKAQQLRFIRLMSLGCSAVSALVLLLLVWRLLGPLQRLGDVTRTIAGGDYAARAPETGGAELRGLAADMNVMAASVEENVRRLTQVAEERRMFIANLSHEMKTPLTSILGFADILRISREMPEKERREYAGIIVEEAGRLKTLSGKLMELLTVGSTELSRERISLPELFEVIAASLRPVLAGQEMTLTVIPAAVCFAGDTALIKSLLYNLLDNAVKASARGGEIVLSAAVEESRVRISVTDHGIGMSPETVARATQPFYMANKSRSRKAGGAGLGLALCAEIARAHGGELTIESELGCGTTVIVTLPCGAQEVMG